MHLTPYAAVAAVIIAVMLHPVFTRPPSAVIHTEPHPGMLRAALSRASLPALPCAVCSLITLLAGGPSAVLLGPVFALYAVAFIVRAAFSDANPKYHNPEQSRRWFPRQRRPWAGLEPYASMFMVFGALGCAPVLLQENTTDATGLVAASGVLAGALLLAIFAGTLATSRWAALYVKGHEREALTDLSDTLRAAHKQGFLVVDEGAYHFTDPVLARHYAGTHQHPAAAVPPRALRWSGRET